MSQSYLNDSAAPAVVWGEPVRRSGLFCATPKDCPQVTGRVQRARFERQKNY
jgi:hypothetical protein